jgi:hypothetical protein
LTLDDVKVKKVGNDLVPALVEGKPGPDPWAHVQEWALASTSVDAERRLRLLGLPGGAVPKRPPCDRPPTVTSTMGRRRRHDGPPVVVNLSSLWAGPLAAHILHRRGAHVINVESCSRPDGLRVGAPAMFDMLHAGQQRITLELRRDLDQLVDLLRGADLVIESSRPRALEQAGIRAAEFVSDGTSWLSITAHGRASNAIGFGDDVAATAGMVIRHDGEPRPVGDALADPLTGLEAAAAAVEALASPDSLLIDVSMLHTVARAVGPVPEHRVCVRDGTWWVESASGLTRVRERLP